MGNFNLRIISVVLLVGLLTIGVVSATKEVLTTSGVWKVPDRVTSASATLISGGGGGQFSSRDQGGCGGQAGTSNSVSSKVIPGGLYPYVVGDGGTAGYQLPNRQGEPCKGTVVGGGFGGDTSMFGTTVHGGYPGLLSGYDYIGGAPGEVSYWSPYSNGGHGASFCPPGAGHDATNGSGGEIILVYNEDPINITSPIQTTDLNTKNKPNESLIDYIFKVL